MDSENSDEMESDYLRSSCAFCGGAFEFPSEGVAQAIACPHCGEMIRLLKGLSPSAVITTKQKASKAFTESKVIDPAIAAKRKSAAMMLACSMIALAVIFYVMPSTKEISENQSQLKASKKTYDEYHNMPSAAREYTDHLVKDGGGSIQWFDQQFYDALSKPQSRWTGRVFFWTLVSLGFFCRAVYLFFPHNDDFFN